MEKGIKNLQTAARARRTSDHKDSSPGSHHSDLFPDSHDSGMGTDMGSRADDSISIASARGMPNSYPSGIPDTSFRYQTPQDYSHPVSYPFANVYSHNASSMSYSPRGAPAYPPTTLPSNAPRQILPPFNQQTSASTPTTSLPGVSNLFSKAAISASY